MWRIFAGYFIQGWPLLNKTTMFFFVRTNRSEEFFEYLPRANQRCGAFLLAFIQGWPLHNKTT